MQQIRNEWATMTYDELKSKAKWFDAPRNWGDTDEEILANIKVNIQLEASNILICLPMLI